MIPDAPYIVEAMEKGVYSPDHVYCPLCEKRCQTIYRNRFDRREVIGCDNCVMALDADDWREDQKNDEALL